jgi:hypothetical protein
MLVSNTGAGSASDRLYRLEYASGACDASWTQVPGVGDESKPWVMSASGFINNASATTDLSGLSNPAGKTFVAGVAMTTASQTAAHTLANSKFTELEYSIAATSNVVTNTTYCFRLTHAGSTTGFTYSQVPQIVAISQVFRSRTGGGGGVEAPSSAPDDQVGGAVGGGGGVGGVEGGGGGSIASGTAVLQSGAVSSVNIGSGGSGYASPPSVSFCSGGGNSAAGTAVMEGGSVSSVNITNGGSGYSSAPVVVFGGSCGGAGGGDDGGDSGFLFDVQSNFASVADIPISEILNFFASLFNFNKWEKI